MLDTIDKNAFIAGLRNGMGFTKSAQLIGYTPPTLSKFLLNDPLLYRECRQAVAYAAKALMLVSQEFLMDKKLIKWAENNTKIRAFIHELVLWESYCTRAAVTPVLVTEAYLQYGDWEETATACGFTRAELNQYLLLHPAVLQFLRENQNLIAHG